MTDPVHGGAVLEFANTYVSLLRGTGEDDFGDPTDSGTVVLEHIPFCLTEQTPRVFDPSNPEPRTVRNIKGAGPSWAGITDNDQLLDERTGNTYMVIDVIDPSTLVATSHETVVTLRRITSSGT